MESTLKHQIMDNCPEGFRGDLEAFLHLLITQILTIRNRLGVTALSFDTLSDIEEAREALDKLADELYFDKHTTIS